MAKDASIFSFYETDDYRIILGKLIQGQKKNKLSLTQIANDSGIQASYLSSVVNGKTHLSQDQLFAICGLLKLSDTETDYLLLLLDWERSGFHSRKAVLKKKIDELRDNGLRIEKILSIKGKKVEAAPDAYYLDPHVAILHLYLEGHSSKQDIAGISQDLRLSANKVQDILQILKSLGLIKKVEDRWQVQKHDFHLSSDSPIVKMNQLAFRSLAIERILSLPASKHYSFGATISLSEEDATQIRVEFLKFIDRCQAIVSESNSTKLMQLNFDLFPWVE